MRVNLLGTVELVSPDGAPVPLGAAKRRAVLAALALELNRVVSGDRLMSLVWDGSPPPQAKAALQGHIAQLRKVLGSDLELVTRAPGYLLTGDRATVDVLVFEDLIITARDAADEDAVRKLTDALQLWRGPFLSDLPSAELRDAESARLEELRLLAVQDLTARLIRLERAPEALSGHLHETIQKHPLREALVAQGVLALHRAGRQAEALDLFHQTRKRLADELGVDPGPELRAAYEAVLAGEVAVAEPKQPVVRQPVPAQLPREHNGFVGRDEEIAQLDTDLTGHDFAIGLLVGPPGVGKTALALHWAHRMAAEFPDGQLFANLRGFDETEPVEPRAALTGFLRALGMTDAQIATDLDHQAAQFRSLLAGKRVLVVLDNARSADQVRPLLPGSARCLVLVTSRHGLSDLVVTEGASVLPVHTLEIAAAKDLLTGMLGVHRTESEPQATAELVELCDRLPLALRVAGARLASRPRWTVQSLVEELRDEQNRLDALSLPEAGRGVHAALTVSYRELPAGAAQMFRGLGLHPGTDLDGYAAAALSGISVGAARTHLRTVAWANLLHESTPDRYSRHDLVRLFTRQLAADDADNAVSTARLLDYYLYVADSARALLSDHVRPFPAPEHPPTSYPELSSHNAAVEWFTQEETNLRLLMELAEHHGEHERTWKLALCVDSFHFRRGNPVSRLEACLVGLRAARALHDEHVEATLLLRVGSSLAQMGRIDQAIHECDRALQLARGDQHVEYAALGNLGYCLLLAGRDDEARERFGEALAIARLAGDVRAQANILNNLANVLLRQHEAEEALACADEALRLYRSAAFEAHAPTLHTTGTALVQLGRLSEALQAYLDSLAQAEQLGDQYQAALCHRAVGDVLELLGGAHVAAPHWQLALRLYRELGLSDADELAQKLSAAATVPPARRPAADSTATSR
ncbi:SARP family transcriptional regulator [Lentzea sp. NBRC 105346]|uniref:AfsR/SARP family transcriptional regulator n=1 Tax=Lentzea sp. NBRC 105346 TaxID=3032205 RepID=UPI0024A05E42|nr:BTAD domain-containing putative transcriptional regulator [Lentzea sp. NBRC 105346]GLZ30978.1 SARP family transcriptional regulator [Lentzea sp. NBRC 105346]